MYVERITQVSCGLASGGGGKKSRGTDLFTGLCLILIGFLFRRFLGRLLKNDLVLLFAINRCFTFIIISASERFLEM